MDQITISDMIGSRGNLSPKTVIDFGMRSQTLAETFPKRLEVNTVASTCIDRAIDDCGLGGLGGAGPGGDTQRMGPAHPCAPRGPARVLEGSGRGTREELQWERCIRSDPGG